jgi:hypothetical protein
MLTVLSVNLTRVDNELRFRGEARQALEQVLDAPAVRAGLRCGPVYTPNHKIVPDTRWLAGLGPGGPAAFKLHAARWQISMPGLAGKQASSRPSSRPSSPWPSEGTATVTLRTLELKLTH